MDTPSLLEARAEAVERLCDGLSHDTRNPLNAVVIHLEVLSDKLRRENGGAVPAALEKNLKAIHDQVDRLDEIVRRFVELAAPRRQHAPDFDLAALCRSVVTQCTHQARLARTDLRAEGPDELRVPGQASPLGVALALALFRQVEAGAHRLVLRLEARAESAVLSLEGTAQPWLGDGVLGAAVRAQGGRIEEMEIHLPLAALPARKAQG